MKFMCGCGKEVTPEEGFMALNADVKFFLCKECQEKFWKWHTETMWWSIEGIIDDDRVSIGKKVDWLEDGCPGDRAMPPYIAFRRYMGVSL